MDMATKQLQSFLSSVNGTPDSSPEYTSLTQPENISSIDRTHFTMDFSVNYAGLSIPTVEYTHPDYAT